MADALRRYARPRYFVAAAALIVFALLFTELFVAGVLLALVVASALVVNVVGLRPYGVELVLFTTVLVGVAFGPVAGGFFGLVAILTHLLIGQYLGLYAAWVVPAYVLAGVLAPAFGFSLVLPVAVNAGCVACTALFTPGALGRYLPYALGNVVVNVVLFRLFGPLLVG